MASKQIAETSYYDFTYVIKKKSIKANVNVIVMNNNKTVRIESSALYSKLLH